MPALQLVQFGSFVLSAVLLIAMLVLNREFLRRIHTVIELLEDGSWRNCPLFLRSGQQVRKKDCASENGNAKNTQKGGDFCAD